MHESIPTILFLYDSGFLTAAWPRSRITGRMGEADLLGAATRGHDPGRRCEGWFHAGVKRLLSGDAAAEIRLLEHSQPAAATPGRA